MALRNDFEIQTLQTCMVKVQPLLLVPLGSPFLPLSLPPQVGQGSVPSPSGSLDKPRLGREVAENIPGASEPSSSSLSSFGENPTLVLCHVFTVVFIYRQYKCPSLKCARFILCALLPLLYAFIFVCGSVLWPGCHWPTDHKASRSGLLGF